MATYRNPYHDTSLGEGLNNLAIAMFSPRGPKPEDLAKQRAYEAQASKYQAEAADTRALMAGRENFLPAAIPSLGVAGDDVPIVQQYLKTGMFPAREDERLQMSTVPGVPVAGWTPEAEAGVRELQELSAAIMAGGGNADQIMNARKTGRQLSREDQVLAGDLDPTRWFQMNLKPVVDIQEGYRFNPADPNVLQEELGVAKALIGQRDAQADLYRSQVGGKDPALQQKIDALVASGLPLHIAQGIAAGRYTTSVNPISGERVVMDLGSGRPVGGMPAAPPVALAPVQSAIPADVNAPAATGTSGFLGGIANTISDALGRGTPFDKVEQGKNALDNLRVQSITLLQDAVPGRPSNALMQQLQKLTITPGNPFQGDARSLDRLTQTRNMLATEVQRMERDILSNPGQFRPQDITATRLSHSQLQQLLREYDTIIQSFGGGGQAAPLPIPQPPPTTIDPSSGAQVRPMPGPGQGTQAWTMEDEQRLQELERKLGPQ